MVDFSQFNFIENSVSDLGVDYLRRYSRLSHGIREYTWSLLSLGRILTMSNTSWWIYCFKSQFEWEKYWFHLQNHFRRSQCSGQYLATGQRSPSPTHLQFDFIHYLEDRFEPTILFLKVMKTCSSDPQFFPLLH